MLRPAAAAVWLAMNPARPAPTSAAAARLRAAIFIGLVLVVAGLVVIPKLFAK